MKKVLVIVLIFFSACKSKTGANLYLVEDALSGRQGYVNANKDTIIPLGKYKMCYTDTFKQIAFVVNSNNRLVAIDRNEHVLFEPFIYDNGPDYEAEGYYRITENNKMGYADTNGRVVIKPQFGCALPFEKGKAQVGYNCKTVAAGDEHWYWQSSEWFYIDKTGKRIK